MQTFEGAKVFADSRGKSLQTLDVITIQYFAETYSFLDSASCASSEAIFKLSEFSVFVVASIVSFNFFSDATFSLINVNDVSLVTFAFGAETALLYSIIKTLSCHMKTNSDYHLSKRRLSNKKLKSN